MGRRRDGERLRGLVLLTRNYAIGGAPPTRRLTAWEVRAGNCSADFGSPCSEHSALRKMRASAPFGRVEPPGRRRSCCIVTAQSRQGRPKIAHRFIGGLRGAPRRSPGRDERNRGVGRDLLSSLTGLDSDSRRDPALKRWAIFFRPVGLGAGNARKRSLALARAITPSHRRFRQCRS